MSDVPAETVDTPAPAEPDPEPTETVDYEAELAKWKANARKNEERAKANAAAAKELAELKRSSMSDLERAVDEAKQAARAEVLREVGGERVRDAFAVVLAGRDVDADALLEGLDGTKFLGDDGQPDRNAIAAWVNKVAPQVEPTPAPLDLGQGNRGGQPISPGDDPLLKDLVLKVGPPRG